MIEHEFRNRQVIGCFGGTVPYATLVRRTIPHSSGAPYRSNDPTCERDPSSSNFPALFQSAG